MDLLPVPNLQESAWSDLLRAIEDCELTQKHPSLTDRLSEGKLRPKLPSLSDWLSSLQSNDQVCSPKKIPAMLLSLGPGAQITPFGDPDDHSSYFRFSPAMETMFPRITLNIREHIFVGDEEQRHRAARKLEAKVTGMPAPAFTPLGFDANSFPRDHMEEEFTIELDQLAVFETSTVSGDELNRLCPGRFASDRQLQCVTFVVAPDERLSHIPLQSTQAQFTAGSAQAVLRTCLLSQQKSFKILLDGLTDKKSRQVWENWNSICLPARALSRWQGLHDDWWFGRLASYVTGALKPFDTELHMPYQNFPMPEHLKTKNERGQVICRPIYAIKDDISRTHFSTMRSYASHIIAAVLYERDEFMYEVAALYNEKLDYPAHFKWLGEKRWRIDIRLQNPNMPFVSKTLPTDGTEVRVYIKGDSVVGEWETAFDGEACVGTVPDDFDFSVVAPLPEHMLAQERSLVDDSSHQVFVVWSEDDRTAERRLLTMVHMLAVHHKLKPHINPNKLQLASLVRDGVDSRTSPDYLQEYADHNHDEQTAALIPFLRSKAANVEQRAFLDAALHGVVSNILLLQGFPGTGKTNTLALFILILMLMKVRVLVTSQSNNGVQALFSRVVELIEGEESLAFLRNAVVQIRNERDEENLARFLKSDMEDIAGTFAGSEDWMSRKIETYCEQHPEELIVREYRQYIDYRERGHSRPTQECRHTWPQVRTLIRKCVFNQSYCVGASTFNSARISPDDQYAADVIIVDEASVATEADVAMAILNHIGSAGLLVLAGDDNQLEPVVKSLTAQRNPLGSVLATSPFARLIKGWHNLRKITLVENFRSHPTNFAMASSVFYRNMMRAGGDPGRWNTPVSRAISSRLGRLFPNNYQAGNLNNRQLFLDVQGLEAREPNGTSKYNERGIAAIIELIQILLQAGAPADDIGVITMYTEDKRRIIQSLRTARLATNDPTTRDGVLVSSVDGFQGKERDIIIVHFVATPTFRAATDTSPFGFVSQRKRLCVSVTRPKSWQFLVGNMTRWQRWRADAQQAHPRQGPAPAVQMAKPLPEVMDWVTEHQQVVDWAARVRT